MHFKGDINLFTENKIIKYMYNIYNIYIVIINSINKKKYFYIELRVL